MWFLESIKNYYSQFGEDGVIEKAFEIMGTKSKWCVEFGAWDGKHLSNTHYLMKEKGWKGVFIEGSSERHKDLTNTYVNNKNAICLNKMVSFEGKNSLDNILNKTDIPENFDLLSIDVDGNDYHVWESLKRFFPRMVVIEFNQTIPVGVDFIQPRDMSCNQGSSLSSLVELAAKKGYKLIVATENNAFFVQEKDYDLFGLEDVSVSDLWITEEKYKTNIFQLYDGTLVLSGHKKLLWHGFPIPERKLQVLPRYFRTFTPRMSFMKKKLYRFYKKIKKSK